MQSRLATLKTDEEMTWIYGYMSYMPGLRDNAWIGGQNEGSKWFWDGDDAKSAEITITDWASAQPDNAGGNQKCLKIFGEHRADANQQFKWDDDTCSKS